jgi:hypothetical protein
VPHKSERSWVARGELRLRLGKELGFLRDALPILLDHLQRGGYPDRVTESLGHALAVAVD